MTDQPEPVQEDLYADVPPPQETDGPQEAVDWTELEEEQHPSQLDQVAYPAGVDSREVLDDLTEDD
jgi:hypothetical protein